MRDWPQYRIQRITLWADTNDRVCFFIYNRAICLDSFLFPKEERMFLQALNKGLFCMYWNIIRI